MTNTITDLFLLNIQSFLIALLIIYMILGIYYRIKLNIYMRRYGVKKRRKKRRRKRNMAFTPNGMPLSKNPPQPPPARIIKEGHKPTPPPNHKE